MDTTRASFNRCIPLILAAAGGRLRRTRPRYYRSLKTWPSFSRGWTRRVARVRAASLALVLDP